MKWFFIKRPLWLKVLIISAIGAILVGAGFIIFSEKDNEEIESLASSTQLSATSTEPSVKPQTVQAVLDRPIDTPIVMIEQTQIPTPTPAPSKTTEPPKATSTTEPPKVTSTTQPQQTSKPTNTPDLNQPGEWSEWSEWMSREEYINKIGEYASKQNEFERAIMVRTIIGDMHYIWRYQEITVDWQPWVDNTDGLTVSQIMNMYSSIDTRVDIKYNGNEVKQFRYGDVSYSSNWSAWQPEPISSEYQNYFLYCTDFEIDYDNCQWTPWRIENLDYMSTPDEQMRYVYRFRWRNHLASDD